MSTMTKTEFLQWVEATLYCETPSECWAGDNFERLPDDALRRLCLDYRTKRNELLTYLIGKVEPR